MRKIFLILLIFVLTFSLSGCEIYKNLIDNIHQADNVLAGKTAQELINEGNYLEAYKILLEKDDEESQSLLKNFVFLPEQTVITDAIGVTTEYYYTWDDVARPTEIVAHVDDEVESLSYKYGAGRYSCFENEELSEVYILNDDGALKTVEFYYSGKDAGKHLYEYDKDGNIISISSIDEYNEKYSEENYHYNDSGLLIKVEEYYNNKLSAEITLTYDNDKVIKRVYNDCFDGIIYETVYTYDSNGRVTKLVENKTDADGEKTNFRECTYKFNDDGKPVEMIITNFKETEDEISTEYKWYYDEFGNFVKEERTCIHQDEKEVYITEHKNYNIYYVTNKHCVIDDMLEMFQADLTLFEER